MKPNKLFIRSTLIFSLLVIFSPSCKKSKLFKDTEPPVIYLPDGDSTYLPKGSAAVDFGVAAIDKRDGDCTSSIKSNWDSIVSLNKTGLFEVTYTANDKSNNIAHKKRFLHIYYNNLLPEGEYNCLRNFSVSPYGTFPAVNCVYKISRSGLAELYTAEMTVGPDNPPDRGYAPTSFTLLALDNNNANYTAGSGKYNGYGTYDAATKKLTVSIWYSVFIALNQTDVYKTTYELDLSKTR